MSNRSSLLVSDSTFRKPDNLQTTQATMAPKGDFEKKRKLPSRSKDSDSKSKKPKFEKRPARPTADKEDSTSDNHDNGSFSDQDDEGGVQLNGHDTQKYGDGPARSNGNNNSQGGNVFEKGWFAVTWEFLDDE